MSHTIPFNTLHHYEKMVAAGFTEKQAKAQTEAIAELVDEKLATKNDLKKLELAIVKDLKELELRITIKIGCMIAAAIGILDFLLKR